MEKQFKFILFLFLTCNFSLKSQQLYDDFETTSAVEYTYINGIFNNSEKNQDTLGLNTSKTCAKYTRNPAVAFDVILMEPSSFMEDLSDYLSGEKEMTMLIKSDTSVTVQITLENKTKALSNNYPTGRHSVYLNMTSGSGNWEELKFKFDQQPDPNVSNIEVDRMVLLIAPNSNTKNVYYIDNIMGPEFTNPCKEIEPVDSICDDFDCQRNVSFEFFNGNLTTETNPVDTGNNKSNNCGKFSKWKTVKDGAFGGNLKKSFTIDTYSTAKIDLYDPNAPTDFFMIFQEENGEDLIKKTFTTKMSDDWITYYMNLDSISPSSTVGKFVFLLNPAEESEDSIYLDNFILSSEITNSTPTINLNDYVRIFPNPANESVSVTIETLKNLTLTQLVIYSSDGKEIKKFTPNSIRAEINLTQFSRGAFYILGETSDGNHFIQKIIK